MVLLQVRVQSIAKRAWPPGTESGKAHSPARIKLRGAVMHVPWLHRGSGKKASKKIRV